MNNAKNLRAINDKKKHNIHYKPLSYSKEILEEEKSTCFQNLIQKNERFKHLGSNNKIINNSNSTSNSNIININSPIKNIENQINYIKKIPKQNSRSSLYTNSSSNKNNQITPVVKCFKESPIVNKEKNLFHSKSNIDLLSGKKTNQKIPLQIDMENLLVKNIGNKSTYIKKKKLINDTFGEEDSKQNNEKEPEKKNLCKYSNFIKSESCSSKSLNKYNINIENKERKFTSSKKKQVNNPINFVGTKFLFKRNRNSKDKSPNKSISYIFNENYEDKKYAKVSDGLQIGHFDINININNHKSHRKKELLLSKECCSLSLASNTLQYKNNIKKTKDASVNTDKINEVKETKLNFLLKKEEDYEKTNNNVNNNCNNNNQSKKLKANQNINKDKDEFGDLTGFVIIQLRKGKRTKCLKCGDNGLEIEGFNNRFKEEEIKINNRYLQFVDLSKKITKAKTKNSCISTDLIETTDNSTNTVIYPKAKNEIHCVKKFSIISTKKKENKIQKEHNILYTSENTKKKKEFVEIEIQNLDSVEVKMKKKIEIRKIERNEGLHYSSLYKSKREMLLMNKISKGDKLSIKSTKAHVKPKQLKIHHLELSIIRDKAKIKKNKIEETESFMIENIKKKEIFNSINQIKQSESISIKPIILYEKKPLKFEKQNKIVKIPNISIVKKQKETIEASSNTKQLDNKIENMESFQLNDEYKFKINDIMSIRSLNILKDKKQASEAYYITEPIGKQKEQHKDIVRYYSNPRPILNVVLTAESIDLHTSHNESISSSEKMHSNLEIKENQNFQIAPMNQNIQSNYINDYKEEAIEIKEDKDKAENAIKNLINFQLPKEINEEEPRIQIDNENIKKEKIIRVIDNNQPFVFDIISNKPMVFQKKKKPKLSDFDEEYSKQKEFDENKREQLEIARKLPLQLRTKLIQKLKNSKKN